MEVTRNTSRHGRPQQRACLNTVCRQPSRHSACACCQWTKHGTCGTESRSAQNTKHLAGIAEPCRSAVQVIPMNDQVPQVRARGL